MRNGHSSDITWRNQSLIDRNVFYLFLFRESEFVVLRLYNMECNRVFGYYRAD
jgi:hypothetical protein